METNKQLQWNKLFISFLLLPFLVPSGIEDMSKYIGGIYKYVDRTFTGLTLIACFLILIIYFGRKYVKVPTIIILILAYLSWLMLSAILNGNFTNGYFITAIKIMSLCMLTDYYMQTGHEKDYLSALCAIFELIILVNFICIIVFPDGMYVEERSWGLNWILGYKNRHIYYFIPYVVVKASLQYLRESKLKLSFYFMCAVILVSTIFAKSTTSLIVMIILMLCIVLFRNFNLPRVINPLNIMLASAAISLILIGLGYISSILPLIEDLFGKNTLYRRNLIWTRSLLYIAENPIIGKGNFSFDLSSFSWVITQTHNKFIDLLITGGIGLLVLFFLILMILTKKINDVEKYQYRNIVNFSFALYAVLFLTEARRQDYLFFMVIILAYYLPKVEGKQLEKVVASENSLKIGKLRLRLK